MSKVQVFLVDFFSIEKVSGRIYKGNPFIKNNLFFMKIDPGAAQLENPPHMFIGNDLTKWQKSRFLMGTYLSLLFKEEGLQNVK